MTPDVVRQWQKIVRDAIIVLIGTFMLVYETVWKTAPDWQIIAAALTCFGLPPALRVDLKRKNGNGDPNGKESDS